MPKTKVDDKIEPKSDGESDDLSRPPKLHKVEYDSNWSYLSGGAWTQDPWDTQSCRERREKYLMKRAVRHLSFKSEIILPEMEEFYNVDHEVNIHEYPH